MNDQHIPDFSGKVVIFYQKDRPDTAASCLENPVLELQGDRYFVSGLVPKGATTKDWAYAATSCIAWDTVQEYYVMEYEEYEKYIAMPSEKPKRRFF